ncbi:MAG TPA: ATP-dependent Clp protease proteolytic subunit [Planctomycetes bacterium]|nr:ATP-dependent Clp protease proteolytic subunit [Planctomycetota bacterium]
MPEPAKGVYVIEKMGSREYQFDIWSRLLLDRIVFIRGEITDDFANYVIAQLLFLQKENRNNDINVFINSPGGSVTAGLAIYDTLKYVQCDVATFCIGQAASMAALLLASGTRGKRFALPRARIMIHQPWGGAGGTATDIGIQAREIGRLKTTLNGILAEETGKDIAQVEKDTDRDFFMSAEEATEYGIVDEIVNSLKEDKK